MSFARFAWGVLAYNVGVVLWGAYVRATGSGAGCGSHWPLCNGEVIPRSAAAETIIEYTHRLTSGLAVLAVTVLCVWAFRRFGRGRLVRLAAGLSLAFILIEALLGAGLVLLELVERDQSVARAAYLAAHLANTQVLLAMLTLTAWFGGREQASPAKRSGLALAALPVALAVSATGAVAALGDTLFPASSVAAGVREEFSGSAHLLVRVRVLHPVLALAGGAYLIFAAMRLLHSALHRKTAAACIVLVFAQLIAGAVNIALLAPIWMQITHLLIANLLWIALVLLAVQGGGLAVPTGAVRQAATPA